MPDLDLLLDSNPRSVAPARAEFRRYAASHMSSDDVDEASVIVSELVTNAQRVSPDSQVVLHVSVVGELMRIEVVDGAATLPPSPRPASLDAENGRGLILVAALAHRWGTSPHRLGKCVWAELPVHLRPIPA